MTVVGLLAAGCGSTGTKAGPTTTVARTGAGTTASSHGPFAAGVRTETFTDTRLTNGLRYRYSISVVDQAGNTAKAGATATPLALSVPRQGTRLTRPPNLTWSKVVGASYYNVQLFQRGKKILSVWPLKTSFRLPRSWTFAGKKHALTAGSYRWYVWAGTGARSAARYTRLGTAAFAVR